MVYTTALQVAQATGLGVEVIDESVGTGDNAETDYVDGSAQVLAQFEGNEV